MGLYIRPNSPFWWANLDGTTVRLSLKIPIVGADDEDTAANKQLARRAYNALMGDIARDRFDLPAGTIETPRTYAAHDAWYREHRTAKHRAPKQEHSVLNNLLAFFGKYGLEEITPSRWDEYVTRRMREDGVTPGTLSKELGIFKTVLTAAVGEYLLASPLATVKRRLPKRRPKRTLTGREEPRFERALRRLDPELADLYLVGVGTLLRQRNLIDLRKADHRGDRLVVDTKTGPHQIPLRGPTDLQRRAATVLRRRMPRSHQGVFFPAWQARFLKADQHGGGSARGELVAVVRDAAEAAKIPWGLANAGVVWHSLTRASGATRLLRDYHVDIRTVQLLGNWSSLDQMAEYLGIDPQHFGAQRW